MRKHLFLVVILCGVLLLCGCGKKADAESGTKTAQPTFPLSPEVVEAALPGWEISQTLVHDVDGVVTYMLRPEGAENNLNGIVVNSYDLPETGRTLLIRKLESDPGWPDRTAEQTKAPEWADYKYLFTLAEKLYGGFPENDVLFDAVSGTEMPRDELTLWQGDEPRDELTLWQGEVPGGAYLKVTSSNPMTAGRLTSNAVNIVSLRLFASESLYQQHEASVAEVRESLAE